MKQKQLKADYLINISAGWFLLGVIMPILTEARINVVDLIKIILSFHY